MITSLTKKCIRDIWRMRAQILAISLVIMSGIAVYIMSLSTLHSLQSTRKLYYQSQNFADIFVSLKRAPLKVLDDLKKINGIQAVDGRIVAGINVEVRGFDDPIQGKLISYDPFKTIQLNQPYLSRGRFLSLDREQEIIVSDAFAKAHALNLYDSVDIIINGRKRPFTIVGTALSPEHIYQIAPGAIFPDYKRYAIIWMGHKAFEHAYDMKGAFNEASIRILPNAQDNEILQKIDLTLDSYGGLGAYKRADQISHKFLEEEFKQLRNMAIMFPIIFFSVAGFLLNLVMMRLIQTEKEQIAILKAFGYSNWQITKHYTIMVFFIVLLGILAGILVGAWMGKGLSEIYTEFYKFPYLVYHLNSYVIVSSILICLSLAFLGAYFSIRNAYRLMPAEGMRPEPPGEFKISFIERVTRAEQLSYASKMVLRNIQRKPMKSLMTMTGIACAVGILMVGSFQKDAIDHMMDVHFNMIQKEDIKVSFNEPISRSAIYALNSMPGIRYAESQREVPVRLRYQQRVYLTSIEAVHPQQRLRQIIDIHLNPISIKSDGLILNDYFRHLLNVNVGDKVQVEVLEGKKRIEEIPVVGFIQSYMGLGAYLSFDRLSELLDEGASLNGALISVSQNDADSVFQALKEMPVVSGITFKENAIKNFFDTLGDTILVFTFFISVFGGTLAFGLVFNK